MIRAGTGDGGEIIMASGKGLVGIGVNKFDLDMSGMMHLLQWNRQNEIQRVGWQGLG